jgi:hypothetical protein
MNHMGDVLRVLSSRRETSLQTLMHDRIAIESCENIHLHWRNIRLEMSLSDAARLVDISWRFRQTIVALQGQVVSLPLVAINPYDDIHKRVTDDAFENESPESTNRHKEGIAWMVEQMRAGRKALPIAVRPAWGERFTRPQDRLPGHIWQRLDGFKRYMAHRALGLSTIDCFVVASHLPGCQHKQRAFLEEDEELPRYFGKDLFVAANTDRLSLIESEEQRRLVNEVELLRNGVVHVHLGDTRLEFTREEFVTFAELIYEARIAL